MTPHHRGPVRPLSVFASSRYLLVFTLKPVWGNVGSVRPCQWYPSSIPALHGVTRRWQFLCQKRGLLSLACTWFKLTAPQVVEESLNHYGERPLRSSSPRNSGTRPPGPSFGEVRVAGAGERQRPVASRPAPPPGRGTPPSHHAQPGRLRHDLGMILRIILAKDILPANQPHHPGCKHGPFFPVPLSRASIPLWLLCILRVRPTLP